MSERSDEAIDALLRAEAPAVSPGEPELDPGDLHAWRAGRLDPEAAAEVERVLARSAADRATLGDLSAPVSDALLDRMASAAPSGRRRAAAWVGAGLALAAGIALAVLRAGPPPPPAYTIGAVRGGVQASRAEAQPAPAGPVVFVPAGTLRLTVRPEGALDGPAPAARAFVSRDGGPLTAVPDARLTPGDGGVWTLVAPARALFGAPPARCAVYLALAEGPAPLADLAGQSPADALGADGVRWVRLDVHYRRAP